MVLAKLDRLSRNVAFIATPLEKKVDAVAEFERDAISRRTTEAFAARRQARLLCTHRQGQAGGDARPR